ncbi:MAG: VCBS repeat-containing protein [Bacteroidota bacterium]
MKPTKTKWRLFAIVMLIASASNYVSSQSTSTGFKKHVISNDFISEGVAVGDVNKDGKMDILAGPSWFEGPDWKRHDIDTFRTFSVKTQYSRSFLNHCMDINQDGWPDLIVMDFPGLSADWFENPGKKPGYWKKHRLYDYVGNESPAFKDVDGDGQDDIICADSKTNQMIWLQAPAKGDSVWKRFVVGKKNVQGTDIQGHGLGYGDLNSDGRKDIFTKDGWWEGPADVKQGEWIFHAADIGEDCSQMQVLDVNGDGLPDVVSASAHRYGIWWHPQYKDDEGNRAWDHYTLSFSTSQTHSTEMADFNGDGNPDIVTGKRYFSHLEHLNPSNKTTIDPGTYEKPTLYWFELTPGKKPYWIEHEIDDDSGVGINIEAKDINGDGKPDIIIANKHGIYYFENTMTWKK